MGLGTFISTLHIYKIQFQFNNFFLTLFFDNYLLRDIIMLEQNVISISLFAIYL